MNGEPKKKILLVDDDDLLRGIYSAKLASGGFEVIAAKNGKQAWDILSEGNIPDVIFTGINMPDLGGFELVERVKSAPNLANILIAISSHRGLADDQKRAQELGINDFIVQSDTKPSEVVRRIKLMLGMRDVIKVAFSPEHFDGSALVNLLNHQQGTHITPYSGAEVTLELAPEKEPGVFKVKLVG